MVLLTKEIWIVTPLVLGIIVFVASKIDIVQKQVARSYCTCWSRQIVSYRATVRGIERKEMRQSDVSA